MKRLLALLLTLVLVMSLFAACDSKKKDRDDDDDEETTEASGVDTTNDVVKPIEDPTDDNTGNAVVKPVPDASAPDTDTDTDITGNWVSEMKMTDVLGSNDLYEGLVIKVDVVITDSTVSLAYNDASVETAFATLVDNICAASNITEEEYYQQSGVADEAAFFETVHTMLDAYETTTDIDNCNIEVVSDDEIVIDSVLTCTRA